MGNQCQFINHRTGAGCHKSVRKCFLILRANGSGVGKSFAILCMQHILPTVAGAGTFVSGSHVRTVWSVWGHRREWRDSALHGVSWSWASNLAGVDPSSSNEQTVTQRRVKKQMFPYLKKTSSLFSTECRVSPVTSQHQHWIGWDCKSPYSDTAAPAQHPFGDCWLLEIS